MLAWKPKSNDQTVASVRYRCLLPLQKLQDGGFPIALFDQHHADEYRGVIFSKLYDEGNRRIAARLKSHGAKIVLDICDNHFYNPFGLEQYKRVRADLENMISLADVVVCSTKQLAEVVTRESSIRTKPFVIGDPIESLPSVKSVDGVIHATMWNTQHIAGVGECPRLLWYGSHGSPNAPGGMLDILNVASILERVNLRVPFELVVLSNNKPKYDEHIAPLPFRTVYREWRYDSFRNEIESAAAVIVPITPNDFTLCKSNNRVVLALQHGIPVVASSIPSYEEFRPFCFLDEWESGLFEVLARTSNVRSMTETGRQHVFKNWSVEKIANQWGEIFQCLLE